MGLATWVRRDSDWLCLDDGSTVDAAAYKYEPGAFNNVGDGDTAASLAALTGPTGLGNIQWRRSFSSSLPAWASHTASGDAAEGLKSIASVKADPAGVAAGNYDSQIEAFAGPAPSGSMLTMYHEPEDDMTQAQFSSMITRFASVAKGANSGITVGYIGMEYQWQIGKGYTTFDPDAAGLDWIGIDVYGYYWNIGTDASGPLQDMTGFSTWWSWAHATGMPVHVMEIGVHSSCTDESGTHTFTDTQRAAWLGPALDWLTEQRFGVVSYWNGGAASPPGGVEWDIVGGEIAAPLTAAAWRARQ